MSMSRTQRSIRLHLAAGIGVAILLVGGVGGWAGTSELSGAVIAPGQLVVDTHVKKVQHPTVGIVKELHVREGKRVKAGELLIKLDDTQIRPSLAVILKNLDELAARQARDEAERDDAKEISFPADLVARRRDPDVARLIEGERNLFVIRRVSRAGRRAQLRVQIDQLAEQTKGQEKQVTAKAKEIDWV